MQLPDTQPAAPERALDTAAAESLVAQTWRTAWELPAAYLWGVSGVVTLTCAALSPSWTMTAAGCAALAMGAVRMAGARRVLAARAALRGTAATLVDHEILLAHLQALSPCKADKRNRRRIFRGKARRADNPIQPGFAIPGALDGTRALIDPERVWFGIGFDWTPEHAQKLYELTKVEASRLIPGKLLEAAVGLKHHEGKPASAIGWGAVDGLETRKTDITVAEKTLEGGTLIVGTTQAGKGVLLTNLITQAIWRGDSILVIDPKNSSRLRRAVARACELAGRDAPYVFHPSSRCDVRINPLANFSRTSELASRIAATMNESGPFTAFAWSAVNVACSLMVFCGLTPTIARIESVLAGGMEALVIEAIRRDWGHASVDVVMGEIAGRGLRGRDAALALAREWAAAGNRRSEVAMGIAVLEHDPTHYAKITASLMPTLAMLTAGSLRESLSPEPDSADCRPIVSVGDVLDQRRVLYVCLNALPDPTVAAAIGSILLADLASCAGARYNSQKTGNARVSLFVDECSNVMNRSLIEILNKGAESGIRTTCAMQTVSDLAARLGDINEARMALGNFNSLVSLRTKDRVTQEFVSETFGRTYIANTSATVSSASHADMPGEFTAGYSRQLTGTREDIIPQDVLGKLPNCEYFASLAGGRLIKGRIPILVTPEA